MLESLEWRATGLSGPRPSLQRQAEKDFTNARMKASWRRIWASLRRHPGSNDLLCFERVRRERGAVDQAYVGMQSVSVSKIVGSVGRCGDFDRAFLPAKGYLRERWQGISRMLRRSGTLPPVSRYKVGGSYFVLDGNHRVSVASYHGIERIDAQVTEFYVRAVQETRQIGPPEHRDDTEKVAHGARDAVSSRGGAGPLLDQAAQRARRGDEVWRPRR